MPRRLAAVADGVSCNPCVLEAPSSAVRIVCFYATGPIDGQFAYSANIIVFLMRPTIMQTHHRQFFAETFNARRLQLFVGRLVHLNY
jgi:hypothetical protein